MAEESKIAMQGEQPLEDTVVKVFRNAIEFHVYYFELRIYVLLGISIHNF